MKKALLLLLVALLVTDLIWGQGCSQCRLMAEQDAELGGGEDGNNINTGILYLMAVPYLLLMFLFRKQILGFFKGMAKKNA